MKIIGFTTTTYYRTIYRSIYKPAVETIYILRQVDDFSLPWSNESVAEDIYTKIGDAIQIPSEPDKLFPYLYLVTYFNVTDIKHSHDYIQISCQK